ncbi:MAG TPA: ABC transporter ATP-binding protein [Planctomycetota bacterium]|nr:ABC transporter ATP-binding protein [Planctomycetota bacterium]
MIAIDRLSFRYPGSASAALTDLSLTVREGSLFGLLGPNGSGKTTLVSILAGILTPAADRVRVAGVELTKDVKKIQAFSALVPQEYAFYPRLTVLENLRFFAGVQRIPRTEIAARIAEVLGITGLTEASARRAEHFSGGMKRRLNFAIGMLNRPRLLFLDEPTVGIDPQSRHFILEAVKRINREGTTVIYTSHYMEEVESLCDEIGVLDDGRLLVQGSLSSLLASEGGGHLLINFSSALDEKQRAALTKFAGLHVQDTQLELERCSQVDFERLIAVLGKHSVRLSRVKYGHGNLEELFLHLTRKQLRD